MVSHQETEYIDVISSDGGSDVEMDYIPLSKRHKGNYIVSNRFCSSATAAKLLECLGLSFSIVVMHLSPCLAFVAMANKPQVCWGNV